MIVSTNPPIALRCPHAVWKLALIYHLLMVDAWCSATLNYSGQGTLAYRVYSVADGSLFGERRYDFRFDVSNEKWQIRLGEIPGTVAPTDIENVLTSFDGTNVLEVVTIRQHLIDNYVSTHGKLPGSDPERTNVLICVYPAEFPVSSSNPMGMPLWFACCSGSYLSRLTNNSIPPLWQEPDVAVPLSGYLIPSDLELLDTGIFLPRNCEEHFDGIEYTVNQNTGQRRIKFRYPSPYSNGFSRIQFKVDKTTNLDDHVFPKEFHLQEFKPLPNGQSSNDLRVACEYVGTVSQITWNSSQISENHGVEPHSMVTDYRTIRLEPPLNHIAYIETSAHLSPISPGSVLYSIYLERIKSIPHPGSTTHRNVMLTTLLLIALFFPILLIFRSRAEKQ